MTFFSYMLYILCTERLKYVRKERPQKDMKNEGSLRLNEGIKVNKDISFLISKAPMLLFENIVFK